MVQKNRVFCPKDHDVVVAIASVEMMGHKNLFEMLCSPQVIACYLSSVNCRSLELSCSDRGSLVVLS
jgi:hypothetical protein